jgi:hypothetical protein
MGSIINAVISGEIDKALKALQPPRGGRKAVGIN